MLNSETHFSQVPAVKTRRSLFNNDHQVSFSFDSGILHPVEWIDVIPGATYQLKANHIVTRMSQPGTVPFGELYQDVFWFFVPYRLVWEHAENFFARTYIDPVTGKYYYSPSIEYTIPQLYVDNPSATGDSRNKTVQLYSVAESLGVPPAVSGQSSSPGFYVQGVSALPFRAYCMIWNTYFRSQELQDPIRIDTGDSSHQMIYNEAQYGGSPLPVDKFHDYFTSCTKAPQRGPDVPVIANVAQVTGHPIVSNSSGTAITSGNLSAGTSGNLVVGSTQAYLSGLSATITATIRDLQTAFAVQSLYSRDELYGGLYRDILRGQYGVTAPDSRLGLPEFLGGFKTRLNVQQCVQQSETDTTPLGHVGAYSVSVNSDGHTFNYTALEHGCIICVTCVRSRNQYVNGISRQFLRKNRTDFYFPVLAGLPAMAVLSKELSFTGAPADDDQVFGYQEAWADYKYMTPNRVTGMLRPSSQGGSLYTHTYASNFNGSPVSLGDSFIKFDKTVIDQTLLTTGAWAQQFICEMACEFNSILPMPTYNRPASLTHMW